MMRIITILCFGALFFSGVNPRERKLPKNDPEEKNAATGARDYRKDIITLYDKNKNENVNYVHDCQLYDLRCDTLPQVRFWRNIMNLTRDSAYICYSNRRCVIDKVEVKYWKTFNDLQKDGYRDSLRNVY